MDTETLHFSLPSLSDGPSQRTLAGLCKAASDLLRLDIMRVLSKDSFGVQELARILDVPQPGMSHHLKILFKAGLLVTRRQGNSVFYRRALLKGESDLNAFQASLYAAIDASPLSEIYVRRMSAVHKERSQQSQAYFARNATKFQEQQGLLCELNHYLSSLKELVDLMRLPRKSHVMEVGPGEGQLLEELASRFDSVVALDSSEEMLSLTRRKLGAKNKKIIFVNSSLESYEAQAQAFDAVVLNMVMHHMPSPARAFQKLKQVIREGGYLLIADLCSHDQEWTRQSCGDVWLGFDPQDLNDWAKDNGFEEEQSSYLGLKNGFQIQLKVFRKLKGIVPH